MNNLAQFLIAFGAVCGIAAWFLFQKALPGLVQRLQTDHISMWEKIGCPDSKSPAYQAVINAKFRQYILGKEYSFSHDIFVKEIGALLRQRLLFCFFCVVCMSLGVLLSLVNIISLSGIGS